jgi:spermidine dehydrogenase
VQMSLSARDRQLGMDRTISRREFLNGAAMMVGASLLPDPGPEPQEGPGYDPPVLTGMRGSHPGSFEIAHSLRDGTFWRKAGRPVELREKYDLIVVGGGISGLAAAHFFRERVGKSAQILILENHDDFGGHAKRNEFHLGGRLALLNGGTLEIDSPTPYSREAGGRSGINCSARFSRAALILRGISKRSRSTAGRTATVTNTTRSSIQSGPRESSRTS